jgi:hypothetical protein
MTDDEQRQLMERYEITISQALVYHFRGFRYGNFSDALDYAQSVTERESDSAARTPTR